LEQIGGMDNMAFGKRESYNDDLISYTESVDMLLHDLQSWKYKNLTKDRLNEILQGDFSIGYTVRLEIGKILDKM
jgi:hypothetical protein